MAVWILLTLRSSNQYLLPNMEGLLAWLADNILYLLVIAGSALAAFVSLRSRAEGNASRIAQLSDRIGELEKRMVETEKAAQSDRSLYLQSVQQLSSSIGEMQGQVKILLKSQNLA